MCRRQMLFTVCMSQALTVYVQKVTVTEPDQKLKVRADLTDGKLVLRRSPLGFVANVGDFSQNMKWQKTETSHITDDYTLNHIKVSNRHYEANRLTVTLEDSRSQPMDVHDNTGGNTRRTTEVFQLAVAVLFQNLIHNLVLASCNLIDTSEICFDFMKKMPTAWEEIRFIDGYPGKYVVLARCHGDIWYVVGINTQKEPITLTLDLPMFKEGETVNIIKTGRTASRYWNGYIKESRASESYYRYRGCCDIRVNYLINIYSK